MHVRGETTQFVDICIFIQTMNYQFPRPRMLQMEFDPNWTSGFNLSLKELMFESVDRQQTMTETVYPTSSPRAFSSGELKSIKTVQAYKVIKPIKSQPNMISEEITIQIFFPIFFSILVSMATNNKSIASRAIHAHSLFNHMEKGFNRNS